VQTPYRAPNCNAHAERFVRSIKKNVWIGWCSSVRAAFGERWRHSENTIITNEITRALATG